MRQVSGFFHTRGILRKDLINELFLKCDEIGMCSFWNVIKMECDQNGMWSKWNVFPCMGYFEKRSNECALFGMWSKWNYLFWNVPFLKCDQNVIEMWSKCNWNVIKMECALFGMCSRWNVALFEVCSKLNYWFWNVPILECDQNVITHFGMCPFWNVIKMEL